MHRLQPHRMQDPVKLSRLLEAYLNTLQQSPLHVPLRALSYDTGIPEHVLEALASLHLNEPPDTDIPTHLFYALFNQMQLHFPTIQIFENDAGEWFFVV